MSHQLSVQVQGARIGGGIVGWSWSIGSWNCRGSSCYWSVMDSSQGIEMSCTSIGHCRLIHRHNSTCMLKHIQYS